MTTSNPASDAAGICCGVHCADFEDMSADMDSSDKVDTVTTRTHAIGLAIHMFANPIASSPLHAVRQIGQKTHPLELYHKTTLVDRTCVRV